MSRALTIVEAADNLRVSRRWLEYWLADHPVDAAGTPFYVPMGRRKTFEDADIARIRHPDCSSEIQVERQGTIYTGYVAAVCVPCPPSIRERFRAAWWVFTGRAHAFVWPEPGDLEAIWSRDKPTVRPTPRPFVAVGGTPK